MRALHLRNCLLSISRLNIRPLATKGSRFLNDSEQLDNGRFTMSSIDGYEFKKADQSLRLLHP
jgi:hypothetical protein